MTYTRYQHLAIERAKPPPDEAQIQAIEKELGARLPPSFRQYLEVANGGYLEYVIDVPIGAGQTKALSFCGLFSADEGTFCDETFLGELRSEREYRGIPNEVLPFARDGGGSVVYLDLQAAGHGRVVAFVAGLPAWIGRRTESAFIELAVSFDEYVDLLRIDADAVIEHLAHDATELAHVKATQEWLDIGLPAWRCNPSLLHAVEQARARLAGQG